jgi:hypothetical protein
VTYPDIDEKFLQVLKYHTAGDPMDETVLWTNLHPAQIAKLMYAEYGLQASKTVIRKLLKKHNYRRRKAQKKRTAKEVPNRNEQFENIARLIADFEPSDNPILSTPWKNCKPWTTISPAWPKG